MAKNEEELGIGDLEEFEAGSGIDVSEFEGQRCKLEGVKEIEVETPFDENGEFVAGLKRKVKRLRVYSEAVAKVESSEGKEIEIRASELFPLKFQDEKWGVSTSDNAKINKFLKQLKLEKGLEGVKKIGGQSVVMKLSDKGNFLRFVY
jgi:hypothetical protein